MAVKTEREKELVLQQELVHALHLAFLLSDGKGIQPEKKPGVGLLVMTA